jgi:hypothetical protein
MNVATNLFGKTLVSFASRQIWPQILLVAHLKPEKLILLHSKDDRESKQPARRLKRFFDEGDLIGKGQVFLQETAHDDFAAVRRSLEDLGGAEQVVLNFTGGNKLMSVAGFSWAVEERIPACYLERGHLLIQFFPDAGGAVETCSAPIAPDLVDGLDPERLIRCQLDTSEIERKGELWRKDGRVDDPLRETKKEGDALEVETIRCLLDLGVLMVRRSLRFKVKGAEGLSVRNPHGEIDLAFIHQGRLWIVDCKDKRSEKWIDEALGKYLTPFTQRQDVIERVKKSLEQSEYKAIKDDLLAAREAGGLQAGIIAVRKTELDEVRRKFAADSAIHLASKAALKDDFEKILFPNRTADAERLEGLKQLWEKK